jgi:hypothetical protein
MSRSGLTLSYAIGALAWPILAISMEWPIPKFYVSGDGIIGRIAAIGLVTLLGAAIAWRSHGAPPWRRRLAVALNLAFPIAWLSTAFCILFAARFILYDV